MSDALISASIGAATVGPFGMQLGTVVMILLAVFAVAMVATSTMDDEPGRHRYTPRHRAARA